MANAREQWRRGQNERTDERRQQEKQFRRHEKKPRHFLWNPEARRFSSCSLRESPTCPGSTLLRLSPPPSSSDLFYSFHAMLLLAVPRSLFVPACTSNFRINNGQTGRESGRHRGETRECRWIIPSCSTLPIRPTARRNLYRRARLVSFACSSAWTREQKGASRCVRVLELWGTTVSPELASICTISWNVFFSSLRPRCWTFECFIGGRRERLRVLLWDKLLLKYFFRRGMSLRFTGTTRFTFVEVSEDSSSGFHLITFYWIITMVRQTMDSVAVRIGGSLTFSSFQCFLREVAPKFQS